MAARKKAGTLAPAATDEVVTVEALEAATDAPTAEQQAEDAFIARLSKVASTDGGLVWVDCPLEGYKGVRVAYNTDNRYAVEQLYLERPNGISLVDDYRLMSLFIRRIEWPFDIPAPTPADPTSYEVLFMQFFSLLKWMRGEGYREAKVARWGN